MTGVPLVGGPFCGFVLVHSPDTGAPTHAYQVCLTRDGKEAVKEVPQGEELFITVADSVEGVIDARDPRGRTARYRLIELDTGVRRWEYSPSVLA